MEYILRTFDLKKTYKRRKILDNISFSINDREILGIIGPSGSGKTTLLRCLNLLDTIDEGRIEYFEEFQIKKRLGTPFEISGYQSDDAFLLDNKKTQYLRKNIGIVFQHFNLWENKTVLQNLTLAPRIVLGKNLSEIKEKAFELCSKFGLQDKIDTYAWKLSGGEKQRVSILRTLMMEPRLLLLDEITSALDPFLTMAIMEDILQLQKQGMSIIIVTHHIDFASKLCDRLIFLDEGKILQIDTPYNLQYKPINIHVKKFIEILRATR